MLIDRVGLPPEHFAALSAAVGDLHTLREVVRWGAAVDPPRRIIDVITQDEYTHDVVVPIEGGLFLVFDST
ncbi:MAG: hypothetical protein R3B09_01465 [Nannocystaceae bacterium]